MRCPVNTHFKIILVLNELPVSLVFLMLKRLLDYWLEHSNKNKKCLSLNLL